MAGGEKTHVSPAVIDKRRDLVADLAAQGRTVREIVVIMGSKPPDGYSPRWFFPNPSTGRPWGLATIHADLVFLDNQWKHNAAQSIQKRRRKILRRLEGMYRRAWEKDDIWLALKVTSEEIALTGVAAPQQLAVSTGKKPQDLTDDELLAIITARHRKDEGDADARPE